MTLARAIWRHVARGSRRPQLGGADHSIAAAVSYFRPVASSIRARHTRASTSIAFADGYILRGVLSALPADGAYIGIVSHFTSAASGTAFHVACMASDQRTYNDIPASFNSSLVLHHPILWFCSFTSSCLAGDLAALPLTALPPRTALILRQVLDATRLARTGFKCIYNAGNTSTQ